IKHMLVNQIPLQEVHLRAFLAVANQSMSQTMTNLMENLGTNTSTPQLVKLQSLLASLVHTLSSEQISKLPEAQVRSIIQTLHLFNYVRVENSDTLNRPVEVESTRSGILAMLQNAGNSTIS